MASSRGRLAFVGQFGIDGIADWFRGLFPGLHFPLANSFTCCFEAIETSSFGKIAAKQACSGSSRPA